jgi:hypothetical protein
VAERADFVSRVGSVWHLLGASADAGSRDVQRGDQDVRAGQRRRDHGVDQ